jgi:hypothetical protein
MVKWLIISLSNIIMIKCSSFGRFGNHNNLKQHMVFPHVVSNTYTLTRYNIIYKYK